jgi:hypothetical protein
LDPTVQFVPVNEIVIKRYPWPVGLGAVKTRATLDIWESQLMSEQAAAGPSSGGQSNRDLVAIFAAHLARLLNVVQPQKGAHGTAVQINAFRLDTQLERSLAGTEERAKIPNRLLGYGVVAADRTPQDVARLWLTTVLNRRLRLARAEHRHTGHELFLALCQRGAAVGWAGADLARRASANVGHTVTAPDDFSAVAERLSRVDPSISQGNPATTTREKAGPLWLRASGAAHNDQSEAAATAAAVEVAEELSVWQAITCAPLNLRPLAEGPEFNAFCSVMIKAVEAANAPYGAYITIGLSPFDWADEIGVNTAKKLGTFLKAVRGHSDDVADTGSRGDLAAWQRAWVDRPVPGFETADELWHSELGRALRFPRIAQRADELDEADHATGLPPDVEFQEGAEFTARLDACRKAGVIDEQDRWLLGQLYDGVDLDDLAAAPQMRGRLRGRQGGKSGINHYVKTLEQRLVAFAATQTD